MLTEIGEYVTVAKAAELLDVNESRIRQLVLDGDLDGGRVDLRTVLVLARSIEAYLEAHPRGRTKPGPVRGTGGRPRKEDGGGGDTGPM